MKSSRIAGLLAGTCAVLAFSSSAQQATSAPVEAEAESQAVAAAPVAAAPSSVATPVPTRLQNLLIHAISLIGVEYKFGGSSRQSGFDCSGFVRHVFAESAALELPRSSYAMGRIGRSIKAEALRPGDLVFYNTLQRAYSHVGIYLGEGRFVHAPSPGKSVEIIDMSDSYWTKRFNGARRLAVED